MNGIKSMELIWNAKGVIAVAVYADASGLQKGKLLQIYVPGAGGPYEIDPRIGDNTGGVGDIAAGLRTGYILPSRIGVLTRSEETQPIIDVLTLKPKEFKLKYPGIVVTENKG